MTQLTEHFALSEFVDSQTAALQGFDNTPDKMVMENLLHTAQRMEDVRVVLANNPIHINSGYRCPELNAAVGGNERSQHMTGEAADFTCRGFGSALHVARRIADSTLKFDQLIFYGTWVHISFLSPRRPRLERLTWQLGVGYTVGIHV